MKSSVKAYVIYHQKVLLILRDVSSSNPNTWSLPGGGIETGETDIEAIQRELKEEISLIPQNISFVKRVQSTSDFYVALFVVILAQDEAKRIKLGAEGQKMEFFSFEDIRNINLSPKLKKFFPKDEGLLKKLLTERVI